jgi:hypothetical protein
MANHYFKNVPDFEYVNRDPNNQEISNYVKVKNLFKRAKVREDIFKNLSFFENYEIVGDERPDNVAYKFYRDETLDWVVLLANNILNIQSEWPLPQNAFTKILLEKYGSYDNLYNGIHHYETNEVRDSLNNVILPAGIRTPNTWKTNGNFIEMNNSKISQVSSGDGITPTKTSRITLQTGLQGLVIGSEILVNNISEEVYNGRFEVTSIVLDASSDLTISFTYELPSIPLSAAPTLSTSGREEVLFRGSIGGNSYYYEYFDFNLGYYQTLSSSTILTPITNYEYELAEENKKRGIFILKPDYLNVLLNDLADIMPYKNGSTQYISATTKRGDNSRLYS